MSTLSTDIPRDGDISGHSPKQQDCLSDFCTSLRFRIRPGGQSLAPPRCSMVKSSTHPESLTPSRTSSEDERLDYIGSVCAITVTAI